MLSKTYNLKAEKSGSHVFLFQDPYHFSALTEVELLFFDFTSREASRLASLPRLRQLWINSIITFNGVDDCLQLNVPSSLKILDLRPLVTCDASTAVML